MLASLCPISIVRGAKADELFERLMGENAK
jgi:hypothetical protein